MEDSSEALLILNNPKLFYSVYYKKKKTGKARVIHAPSADLKLLQKDFANWFYLLNKKLLEKENQITGFIPGKSIVDNAKPHLDKDWVINLDIENFFPNTNRELLTKVIVALPRKRSFKSLFRKEERSRFKNLKNDELIDILSLKKGLPQGSPASPILANYIAIKEIDNKVKKAITKISLSLNLKKIAYTRYADDLTISFNEGERKEANQVVLRVMKEIESSHYSIKEQKTNIKHNSQRQLVTGVLVNGGNTRIDKRLYNRIRAAIHNSNKKNEELSDEIKGMLSFINSINKEQYNKLTKNIGEM